MSSSGIERASFDEAARLGHHWAGPEHLLLAILRGDPADPARRALEQAGMDAGMVEQLLGEMADASPAGRGEPAGGVTANPAWYSVTGWARGLAAALGPGEVLPAHVVLAMLWDTQRWLSAERRGVRREAVIEGLRRLDVALPTAALPELQPLDFTQRVEFPTAVLERVLAKLAERHPPGSGPKYGFNHDGADRAWACAEEGIDLQGIVDEALAERGTP